MTPKSGNPGTAVAPASPTEALEAVTAQAGALESAGARGHTRAANAGSSQTAPGLTLTQPGQKTWIEIRLVDEDGAPVPGERYRIELPDGTVTQGSLDHLGLARVEGIDPGQAQVTFPDLDEEAWESSPGGGA